MLCVQEREWRAGGGWNLNQLHINIANGGREREQQLHVGEEQDNRIQAQKVLYWIMDEGKLKQTDDCE